MINQEKSAVLGELAAEERAIRHHQVQAGSEGMIRRVSDLESCYGKLLGGVPATALQKKYVRFEVLAAQELYDKGVTQEELRRFHERQAARLEAAKTHAPFGECAGHDVQVQRPGHLIADGSELIVETETVHVPCGLVFFDRDEARDHLDQNPGHALRSTRWAARRRAKL
jgi:hypothetical protein